MARRASPSRFSTAHAFAVFEYGNRRSRFALAVFAVVFYFSLNVAASHAVV